MSKDYYKTLGVDKNVGQDEIKKAFRKKAHEYHPDKKGGDEAKFKEVNEAYQVLGDAKKRAQYDQFGSAFEHARGQGGFSGFGGFRDFSGFANGFNVNADDIGDIFGGIGDIFGFGGGNRTGTRTARGRDIQVILTVDFEEAVFGTTKDIKLNKAVVCDHCRGNIAEPGTKIETCKTCGGSGRISRVQRTILGSMQVQSACGECNGEGKAYNQLCRKCSGTGVMQDSASLKVRIPAGIDDGESIRLTGQGEAGSRGTSAGDLYVRVRVKQDSRFRREGDAVYSKVKISFAQAALGDNIEVNTVDGPVKMKVPAGTQSGTVFKLRGHGVPRIHGSGRGDHMVEVVIETPKKLSRKQKELLHELGL